MVTSSAIHFVEGTICPICEKPERCTVTRTDTDKGTGSPSSLYEPHKRHNMASNYKGLYGIFYKISMEVVKSEILNSYLIPYVYCLLLVWLFYRFNLIYYKATFLNPLSVKYKSHQEQTTHTRCDPKLQRFHCLGQLLRQKCRQHVATSQKFVLSATCA